MRIDFHNHVIPARMIDAIAQMPEAFAARARNWRRP